MEDIDQGREPLQQDQRHWLNINEEVAVVRNSSEALETAISDFV
jgi:hypothetical protein